MRTNQISICRYSIWGLGGEGCVGSKNLGHLMWIKVKAHFCGTATSNISETVTVEGTVDSPHAFFMDKKEEL